MNVKTQIIFATKNEGKLSEFKRYFENISNLFDIISLKDIAEDIPDCDEFGSTFEENARIKVENTRRHLSSEYNRSIIIADDSGIIIDALHVAPGVHTRRWLGREMTDQEIIDYCLKQMLDKDDRGAIYVSCFAVLVPNTDIKIIQDSSRGVILKKNKSSSVLPGMPFRSLFYIPDIKMMFHEARELNEKDLNGYRLGHTKAIENIIKYLQPYS